MADAIDRFLELPAWAGMSRARLVPFAERASIVSLDVGEVLFEQFYPAEHFWLLVGGAVAHRTRGEDTWPLGRVSGPFAALGWSGFLPPHRYGTTAHAETGVALLRWRHDELATCFYADPGAAIEFLRLVADSVRRQFEAVRADRIDNARRPVPHPAVRAEPEGPRRTAPGLVTAMRRSAFFEQFDDASLDALAHDARPVRFDAGNRIVSQDQRLGGLWLLADGATTSFFARGDEPGCGRVRFRSVPRGGAIVAGVPTADRDYVAEATVIATQPAWLYRLDTAVIEARMRRDPEFGRAYMQRCLARLAHLLAAARLSRPSGNDEPEIAAVRGVLAQSAARIPVTSELHKVPHLLSHRLTIGNAFACLNTSRETGRYEERALARTCEDLLQGVRAELRFYRDILETYVRTIDAPPDVPRDALRLACDLGVETAFAHLAPVIEGLGRLPDTTGHVFVMNHLACPAYYELPNGYHFSFDTAFVSAMLSRRYGEAPLRVVRQSPGPAYGHNLFYRRLGHITVPTVESGLTEADADGLEGLRRAAAAAFVDAGTQALAAGRNLLICPEGQSQHAADSPARFFTGAFRLAREAGPDTLIVPVALAGFDRRYKDVTPTAVVQEPFRLADALAALGTDDLRRFADAFREDFRSAVRRARELCRGAAATAYRPSSVSMS